MLEKLNKLLGIEDTEGNELTAFVLEDAENKVKNYCNIEEIPVQLETTVVRLAVDIFRNGGYGSETTVGNITSIKRGDTQTNFESTAGVNAVETDYISKYKDILNPFRKLRW